MKTFSKITVPLVIFSITLISLLLIRVRFISDSGLHKVKHEWTALQERKENIHPGLAEFFMKDRGERARLVLKDEQGIISESEYRFNEFGLRDIGKTEKKKAHLILTGCSFVFGLGLDEDETMPFFLRSEFPSRNVRNLGVPGGGLHTALRYSEILPLKEFVPEEEGTFLYVMIEDHLNRFLLRPGFVFSSWKNAPVYVAREGKIEFEGNLNEHFIFWKMKFLGFFGLLSLAKSPQSFSDQELEFFLNGVKELKRRYRVQFPRGKFAWTIHPLSRFRESARLEELAKKMDITPQLVPLALPEGASRYELRDHHPNGLFNRMYADALAKIL
jgi:hypothetical protein